MSLDTNIVIAGALSLHVILTSILTATRTNDLQSVRRLANQMYPLSERIYSLISIIWVFVGILLGVAGGYSFISTGAVYIYVPLVLAIYWWFVSVFRLNYKWFSIAIMVVAVGLAVGMAVITTDYLSLSIFILVAIWLLFVLYWTISATI